MFYINHFFFGIHYCNVIVLCKIAQNNVAVVDDNITIVVLQTKRNISWSMAERFLKEVDNYNLVNICQQNGPIIIDSIEIFGIFYYNSTIKFEF